MSDTDDEGWRFAVDDLPQEESGAAGDADGEPAAGAEPEAVDAAGEGEGDGEGNVAGTLAVEDDIEPGQPTVENAFFVALGVLVTVVVALTMAGVV